MLYLGIDQHKRQLTVNLRSEDGSVILKRQVSTEWERCVRFLPILPKGGPEGGFLAILEVCGMNPWLLAMLRSMAAGKRWSSSRRSGRSRRRINARCAESRAVGPSAAVFGRAR